MSKWWVKTALFLAPYCAGFSAPHTGGEYIRGRGRRIAGKETFLQRNAVLWVK